MKVCLKENCAIYNLLLLVFPSFLVHISTGKCNKWQCFVQWSSVCSALFEVLLLLCFFRGESVTPPFPPSNFLLYVFSLPSSLWKLSCEHHISSKERKKECFEICMVHVNQMRHCSSTLYTRQLLLSSSEKTFLFSGSRDNSVKLWDTNTGECVSENEVTRNLVWRLWWRSLCEEKKWNCKSAVCD